MSKVVEGEGTKWGDMSDLEKGELLLHYHNGGAIECSIYKTGWGRANSPSWDCDISYRKKASPMTPPWEVIADKFIAVEESESGRVDLVSYVTERGTTIKADKYWLDRFIDRLSTNGTVKPSDLKSVISKL